MVNPTLLKPEYGGDMCDEFVVGAPEELPDEILMLGRQGEAQNWNKRADPEAQDG